MIHNIELMYNDVATRKNVKLQITGIITLNCIQKIIASSQFDVYWTPLPGLNKKSYSAKELSSYNKYQYIATGLYWLYF